MIRILRMLEYVYDNYEQAEEDMRHWGVPAFGCFAISNTSKIIYSAILPPTTELIREKNEEASHDEPRNA